MFEFAEILCDDFDCDDVFVVVGVDGVAERDFFLCEVVEVVVVFFESCGADCACDDVVGFVDVVRVVFFEAVGADFFFAVEAEELEDFVVFLALFHEGENFRHRDDFVRFEVVRVK